MKKIIKLILAVCLLLCLSVQAFAHPVPDLSQTGTIRIQLQSGEEVVSGGNMTIYAVGRIQEENGDYCFVLTEAFAQSGISLTDLEAPGLADQLLAYAKNNKLTGVTLDVDTTGTVTYSDLELGLYLVVQEQAAHGWNPVAPFLVSVPKLENDAYVYAVDASPKVELEKAPPTEPTQPDGPKLPQTGQRNGLVPLLAVGGMILVLIGALLCLRRRKGQE